MLKKPTPPSLVEHPRPGEKGEKIFINTPHSPSHPDTWDDYTKVATFTPGSPIPRWIEKNKDFKPADTFRGPMQGTNESLAYSAPYFKPVLGLRSAAGMIVVEPGRRVWLTSPTNRYGGYVNTFPKGTVDVPNATYDRNFQEAAIREFHEETGMHAKIDSLLGDFDRTSSKGRYYLGIRTGGSPANMGWETQALHLVPAENLLEHLHSAVDRRIAAKVQEKLEVRPKTTAKSIWLGALAK